LFISHSSQNDDWAIALRDWLMEEGWSDERDIFLDLDPERGIGAGQRWAQELEKAATRCEAVLFLVSKDWLTSTWCLDEYQLASQFNKKLFALLIEDVPLGRLPGGLAAQWQVVRLYGEPARRFLTVHPVTQRQSPVSMSRAGLQSLKLGLKKAGIGAETFELQPDPKGPFGWRAPYRGLEALEADDAAVFFGRNADIVRGIDTLRGLASHNPPRLLVILGASGAGKSSFLRAGLWPRLLRDDAQWLPLRSIRAGRGGALEGAEGLLAALDEVHRRFGQPQNRADLRKHVEKPADFIAHLRSLREAAARRVLLTKPPFPLPVLCLDQAEELFGADANAEGRTLLGLVRAAVMSDEALALATIRSDAFGAMQSAPAFVNIHQVSLSLGPVPQGELARVIGEPAQVLRGKAGPSAPTFDAAVIEQLQAEVKGETDALPLLAFVLQRLMREHAASSTIGIAELKQTGGVAAAIQSAAEGALDDAGVADDHARRRELLRSLFIPRLARIDRESKAPQRRVARYDDLPPDLGRLARALTERRLLVVKFAAQADDASAPAHDGGDTQSAAGTRTDAAATLEVAHEALLRRWPTLADLLREDRDALLLLDGVLIASADWDKAPDERKPDYLAHRGSRLADALALAARGGDWDREMAPARKYLVACQAREAAEREEKEEALRRAQEALRRAQEALAREQEALANVAAAQGRTARLQRHARMTLAAITMLVFAATGLVYWQFTTNRTLQASLDARQLQLDRGQVNLIAELATAERLRGNFGGALRFGVQAARLDLHQGVRADSSARPALAAAVSKSDWRRSLAGHRNEVQGAVFSPDGSRVATASTDKTARIWDVATGQTLAVLRHDDEVNSVAFSPDGSLLATASDDLTVRLWKVASGEPAGVLEGHKELVWSAAFSPDGTRIVTASQDKTARIWDVATAKEIGAFQADVRSAAFSPDGTRIVTASTEESSYLWNAETGEKIAELKDNCPTFWAEFSPDGTRVVTGSGCQVARIYDGVTGQLIVSLSGHEAFVSSASYSPDGKWIVTASEDGLARVWDAATAKEIVALRGHEGGVNFAHFSPDGTQIVTGSRDHTARIWSAVNGKDVSVIHAHDGWLASAAFSPDGSQIVTAAVDKTARIWDMATGKLIAVLEGHEEELNSAVFSPDGSRVLTASDDRTARIWDVKTAKEIAVLGGHEGSVISAVFAADGMRLVTSSGRIARIWDANTGKEIAVLPRQDGTVWATGFSPDGTRLVLALGDGTARIWDVATSKEIVLRGHQGGVYSAVFSPDGSRVLTAAYDGTARIWNASSGEEIVVLRGHKYVVSTAAFSRDGGRVVTASRDRTARIWDTATAMEIAVLNGHTNWVNSASFNHDGTRVVTASRDRTARIWDVHFTGMAVQDLLVEVCTKLLPGLSTLTREEMRLAGYADKVAPIDVCAPQ
jgi:WD40 repeat protein